MAAPRIYRQLPLLGTDRVLVFGRATGVAADPSASITPEMCGLASFDIIVVETDAADNGEDVGLGTIAQFDYTANELDMLHSGTTDAPLNIAADGDVTDVVVRFMAIGPRA